MSWNGTNTLRKPKEEDFTPDRHEVISFLRGIQARNRQRPCAKGYTEFGLMMKAAADMLEGKQ